MIPVKLITSALNSVVQSSYKAQMRAQAQEEAGRLRNVVMELTGDEYVSKRFVMLERKIQRKISWNALRDGLNEYRNDVRKEWRRIPAESKGKKTRRAIAKSYQIRRLDSDTLAAFVSKSKKGPQRKANLLEWETRKTPGFGVATETFETNKRRMLKVIAESVAVQIRQDPENARARRQAVRARLGSA